MEPFERYVLDMKKYMTDNPPRHIPLIPRRNGKSITTFGVLTAEQRHAWALLTPRNTTRGTNNGFKRCSSKDS